MGLTEPARIERQVLAMPLSRDARRLETLLRALTRYRMVFGQPRQEDLVRYLSRVVAEKDIDELSEALRIDLSPPGA